MITHLRGELVRKDPTSAVIDVNGVGYEVAVSLTTCAELPEPGQRVEVLTHQYVREDRLELYGFTQARERELFQLLIGVSGIGPRLAQTILSGLTPAKLEDAIRSGRSQELKTIKGIGAKTAERVVLELREAMAPARVSAATAAAGSEGAPVASEAAMALAALGFSASAAARAAEKAVERLGPDASVQDVIRQALRER